MTKNNLKEYLLLVLYTIIGISLLGYAAYLVFTAPIPKYPPRYKNTLQYDINR